MDNRHESVTCISSRILGAWNDGQEAALKEELGRAASLDTSGMNAVEAERMEVLEGVLESLQQNLVPAEAGASSSARPSQVRAAVRLLEHLASGTGPQAGTD